MNPLPTNPPRNRQLRKTLLGVASAVAILAGGGVLVDAAQPADVSTPPSRPTPRTTMTARTGRSSKTMMPAVVNVAVDKTEKVAQSGNQFNDPDMQKFFEKFFGQQMPVPQQQPQTERLHGEGSGFFISGRLHRHQQPRGRERRHIKVMPEGRAPSSTARWSAATRTPTWR